MFPAVRFALAMLGLTVACAAVAEPAVRIPLVEGLEIITAVADKGGDYESLKRLAGREGDTDWKLQYDASVPGENGKVQRVSSERIVHDADLESATRYRHGFEDGAIEDYPGTTALGASAAVLRALKEGGASPFALVGSDPWMARALAGDATAGSPMAGLAGALMNNPNVSFKGELKRVGSGTLSVLVNQTASDLPVVVAAGRFVAKSGESMEAELSFLDETANPIALAWRIGKAELRVVRIDFPQQKSEWAARLKERKHLSLPGLYFDFGSAALKPASKTALAEIVAAIKEVKGPLKLEGHTDNVGVAADNLALSRQRAEAVREALVALDAGLSSRLSAEGFGATRPLGDDASLQGRAQNRRVELVLP